MTEFYVAFSKHGTNTFITANKQFDLPNPGASQTIILDDIDFKIVKSRTVSKNNGVKLHAGNIGSSMPPVLELFYKLQKAGWNVKNMDSFVTKNKLYAARKQFDEKYLGITAKPVEVEAIADATTQPDLNVELPPNTENTETIGTVEPEKEIEQAIPGPTDVKIIPITENKPE